MQKKPVELAVLFADVSGSTRLYEKLGDARALECVGFCLKIMSEAALGCGGRVVKTIGDELMCVFPTAPAGIQAAADMQTRVEMQEPVSGHRLRIRIGLQFGAVLEEGQDVFGDSVNVAARMAKLANPSQIIAAGECVKALGSSSTLQMRALDRLPVKGREEEIEVYEILWRQSEELTIMATRAATPHRVRLRLRHGGKETILGPERDLVRFGRENSCDVVIADRKASREHARIERRRDKFVLIDISSNGTFVTFHGEPEKTIRREEIVLHGRGSISFGHPYNADPTEVAAFDVENLS
ncbi:MAG: adenylate/guanylate cyclase domain-containing protein [Burkholderiales bacterium]